MIRALFLAAGLLLSACALPDVTPDPPPGSSPYGGRTITYSSSGGPFPDQDFGADSGAADDLVRRSANFAANTEAALASPPMRGGGFTSFEQASTCTVLLTSAEAAVAPCAEELFVDNCGDGKGHYRGSECPRCEVLRERDNELRAKGCPARVTYPPYRL